MSGPPGPAEVPHPPVSWTAPAQETDTEPTAPRVGPPPPRPLPPAPQLPPPPAPAPSSSSAPPSWPPRLAALDPASPEGDPVSAVRRGAAVVLVSALVGALVAAGAFVATDDSDAGSARGSQTITREARQIDESGLDVAAVLDEVVPGVVGVTAGSGTNATAAGTGFVISSDGVIVTNHHVVAGATRIEVRFSNGRSLAARLLGDDAATDLAVLDVDASNLHALELGDSDAIDVGDDVIAIGNALGLKGGLSVTRGIVSGLHRDVPTEAGARLTDMLQTDAAINPGNSGGPLVDARGRVVGINTAIADPSQAQDVGFAIAISQAKAVIAALRDGRRPAYLGVSSVDTDTAAARQLGVEEQPGALVTTVSPGSAAGGAGFRPGDVITRFGDSTIADSGDLLDAIRRSSPGATLTITFRRGSSTMTATVTLGERPVSGS